MIGCAAALLVLSLFLLYVISRKKRDDEYDERQVAARGKAFQAGFFALMLYLVWFMIVNTFEIELLNRYSTVVIFTGIVFGTGVFAVAAIRNDAFLKFNEKKSTQLTVMVLLTVCNAVIAVVNYRSDAESGVFLMNALCAVLGAVILIAILIHQKKGSGYEEKAE